MSEVGDWMDEHPLDDVERQRIAYRCENCGGMKQADSPHRCFHAPIGKNGRGNPRFCKNGHHQNVRNVLSLASGKKLCLLCDPDRGR